MAIIEVFDVLDFQRRRLGSYRTAAEAERARQNTIKAWRVERREVVIEPDPFIQVIA